MQKSKACLATFSATKMCLRNPVNCAKKVPAKTQNMPAKHCKSCHFLKSACKIPKKSACKFPKYACKTPLIASFLKMCLQNTMNRIIFDFCACQLCCLVGKRPPYICGYNIFKVMNIYFIIKI